MTNDNYHPLILGIGELLWDLLPGGRKPGGAVANMIHFTRQLGTRAFLATAVGADNAGRDLVEAMVAAGHDPCLMQTDEEHPTGTVSITIADDGQPDFTIHTEVAWDNIRLTDELRDIAAEADAVCFGSLAQRAPVSRETVRNLVSAAPNAALRVCDINLRQAFWDAGVLRWCLETADVVKLNDEELPVVAQELGLEADPEYLREHFNLKVLALTRGGKGSLLLGEGERVDHPGLETGITDTVGAGDSFAAVLTVGLLENRELAVISDSANRIAAFVCSQDGGTPLLPEELSAQAGRFG
ncbi:carbohydrate kinase [Planctomycetota bacterium]